MIVMGADTHKSTHTVVAVDGTTGALVGERTVAARRRRILARRVFRLMRAHPVQQNTPTMTNNHNNGNAPAPAPALT